MDEKKLLERFAKALGAESTLNEMEAKEQKQKNMLKGMAKLLGTESLLFEMEEKETKEKQVLEEKKAREKELFDKLNSSLSRLVENNPQQINVIEEEIIEAIEQPIIEDLHDLPQIPVRDIVTQAVVDLSKAQQKDVQQVADGIPDSFRKELDIIKKSIADFHRLAQRQSQMGGGGEVNLRYLDDINRGSIFGGNFLKYNASSKKFEFANVTSDGVDWHHVPSSIIPNLNFEYSLGNTSNYWNTLYVNTISIPVGTIIQQSASIEVIVEDLVLASTVDYSTGEGDNLAIGNYGLTNGIAHPWIVYQFTTTPSPILELDDVISGAGVPVGSTVLFVGSGANSNIIITNVAQPNLPVAQPNTVISIFRPIVNQALTITTQSNTNIGLNPGANGFIVNGSSIVPYVTNQYDLGTPLRRFKTLWLGGGTIYIVDETLGVDQALSARDGNFIIRGGAGLEVGQFTFRDNTLLLANSARPIIIGSNTATAPVIFNRPVTLTSAATGTDTFTVTREGRVAILTPIIPANDVGALSIIGSANGAYQGVVNPGGMLHITGNDGVVSRITNDAFGTGVFPAYISRAGRGTANTPSAIQSGDIMSRYSTVGWGANSFPTGPAATNIEVNARENFTNIAQGTEYRIYTAPIGTTSKTLSLTINANTITMPGKLVIGNDTTINGNLIVTGTTLYANVDSVNVANLTITLAYNSLTPALANGAGLVVDNTHVTWLYNYSANSWQSNVSIIPYLTDTYNLGSSTLRWDTLYAKTSNVDTLNSNTINSNTANITNINSNTIVSNTINANNLYSNTGSIINIISNIVNANNLNVNTSTFNKISTFNGNTFFNANVTAISANITTINANTITIINTATFNGNIYITSAGNTGITFNDSTFQNTAYIPHGYIYTAYIGANVAYTSATTAYIIPQGSITEGNRNISLGSNNTFVIEKTGRYLLSYSIQYKNTGFDAVDIYVWLNKNNIPEHDTSTVFSVPAKNSSKSNDPGKLVAVTPILLFANTGDLIQVMAATPYDTTASMVTIPAVVSPAIPRTPASIISIAEVS